MALSDYTSFFNTPWIKESGEGISTQQTCVTPDGKFFIITQNEYEFPADQTGSITSFYISEVNSNYNSQTQRGVNIPRISGGATNICISDDGNTFAAINGSLIVYEWNSVTSDYEVTYNSPSLGPGIFDYTKIITLSDDSLRICVVKLSNDVSNWVRFYKKSGATWIQDSSLDNSLPMMYANAINQYPIYTTRPRIGYDKITDTLRVINFEDNHLFKVFKINPLNPSTWSEEIVTTVNDVLDIEWGDIYVRADGKELVAALYNQTPNYGLHFFRFNEVSTQWEEDVDKFISIIRVYAKGIIKNPILSDTGKIVSYSIVSTTDIQPGYFNLINLIYKLTPYGWSQFLYNQEYLGLSQLFNDYYGGTVNFATGCNNIPLIMFETFRNPGNDETMSGYYVLSKLPNPKSEPDLHVEFDYLNNNFIAEVGITLDDAINIFTNDVFNGATIAEVQIWSFYASDQNVIPTLQSNVSVDLNGNLLLTSNSGIPPGDYRFYYRVKTQNGYYSELEAVDFNIIENPGDLDVIIDDVNCGIFYKNKTFNVYNIALANKNNIASIELSFFQSPSAQPDTLIQTNTTLNNRGVLIFIPGPTMNTGEYILKYRILTLDGKTSPIRNILFTLEEEYVQLEPDYPVINSSIGALIPFEPYSDYLTFHINIPIQNSLITATTRQNINYLLFSHNIPLGNNTVSINVDIIGTGISTLIDFNFKSLNLGTNFLTTTIVLSEKINGITGGKTRSILSDLEYPSKNYPTAVKDFVLMIAYDTEDVNTRKFVIDPDSGEINVDVNTPPKTYVLNYYFLLTNGETSNISQIVIDVVRFSQLTSNPLMVMSLDPPEEINIDLSLVFDKDDTNTPHFSFVDFISDKIEKISNVIVSSSEFSYDTLSLNLTIDITNLVPGSYDFPYTIVTESQGSISGNINIFILKIDRDLSVRKFSNPENPKVLFYYRDIILFYDEPFDSFKIILNTSTTVKELTYPEVESSPAETVFLEDFFVSGTHEVVLEYTKDSLIVNSVSIEVFIEELYTVVLRDFENNVNSITTSENIFSNCIFNPPLSDTKYTLEYSENNAHLVDPVLHTIIVDNNSPNGYFTGKVRVYTKEIGLLLDELTYSYFVDSGRLFKPFLEDIFTGYTEVVEKGSFTKSIYGLFTELFTNYAIIFPEEDEIYLQPADGKIKIPLVIETGNRKIKYYLLDTVNGAVSADAYIYLSIVPPVTSIISELRFEGDIESNLYRSISSGVINTSLFPRVSFFMNKTSQVFRERTPFTINFGDELGVQVNISATT